MTVTKRFGVDFTSEGGALTLPASDVSDDDDVEGGTHQRLHASGWRITGEVHEDYYTWVNWFHAYHPEHGQVYGDFEHEVYATSESAFADFIANHPPQAWDYMDI